METINSTKVRHSRMAFLFTSWADQSSTTDLDIATRTVVEACKQAFCQGSNLIQVLIEMTDHYRHELCLKSGFHCLTDLIGPFPPCRDCRRLGLLFVG